MRKTRVACTILFAVLALAAIPAAKASAAPEWYKNGLKLATKESAVTKGTFTLEGLGIFGIKLKIECNGESFGTVGAGGADEITNVRDLAGKTLLDCKLLERALCEAGTLALLEAEKLPWKSKLEEEAGRVFDSSEGGAFDVRCLLSGGTWSLELCEGSGRTDALVNEANGTVSGKVLNLSSTKCNSSADTAHVSAAGNIALLSGGTLEAK